MRVRERMRVRVRERERVRVRMILHVRVCVCVRLGNRKWHASCIREYFNIVCLMVCSNQTQPNRTEALAEYSYGCTMLTTTTICATIGTLRVATRPRALHQLT